MLVALSTLRNLSLISRLVFKYMICLIDMLLKLYHFVRNWKCDLLIFRQGWCLMSDLGNALLNYTII